MQIGLIYPQTELGGAPEAVRAIGRAAEELGFAHLLAYDHVLGASSLRTPKLTGPYDNCDPFHDPLVMFAYLAAVTSRIELVTGVLVLPQRQTALVARQAADVDLLSGQRLRLGVGIGWNPVEYEALGQDFRTRGRRLGEQIDLLRLLWSQPLVDFEGHFHRVDNAAVLPRPMRQIPIWCGGGADASLERAAAVADGFIFVDKSDDTLELLHRLKAYLAKHGRDQGFGTQCNMLRARTPEEVLETVQRWQEVGGTHACVNTMRMGFSSVDQHIGYAKRVTSTLREAGMM